MNLGHSGYRNRVLFGYHLTQEAIDYLWELRARNFWRRVESYVWTIS